MSNYRPLTIRSACEACRKGECWDCTETVVHPGSKSFAAGTVVACSCHQGIHQWKPQPCFPRKPTSVTPPAEGRNDA